MNEHVKTQETFTSRPTKYCACHEIHNSRSTKCYGCHETCTTKTAAKCATSRYKKNRLSRNPVYWGPSEICASKLQGLQSTAPATKSVHQGPQSAAPATKSALQTSKSTYTVPLVKSAFQGPESTAHTTKSAHQDSHCAATIKVPKRKLRSRLPPMPDTVD